MEILSKLGIDGKLLLAQVVNFAILLWVLKRYAYKPMLEFLESRANRIEAGLRDAEEAKEKLKAAAEHEAEVLREAREEAKRLIASAEADAKKRGALREAETEAKVEAMLASARAALDEERAKLIAEARSEVAGLVTESLKKILPDTLSEKDEELIRKRAEA